MTSKQHYSIGLHIADNAIAFVHYSAPTKTVIAAGIRTLDTAANRLSGDAGKKTVHAIFSTSVGIDTLLVFSLPAECAVIKKLSLDHDENDVRTVVGLELSQHIIGHLDDYTFDYMPLRRHAAVQQYLVAAYHNKAVERLASYVNRKQFAFSIVDLDAFALINVFESAHPELLNKPSIIICAGALSTIVVLSQCGLYTDFDVFRYDTAVPAGYILQLDECLRGLGINRQKIAHTTAVCCTGTLFNSDTFAETVIAELPDAFLLNPFRNIRVSPKVTGIENVSQGLAIATGLALRGGMGYNL